MPLSDFFACFLGFLIPVGWRAEMRGKDGEVSGYSPRKIQTQTKFD
jgi:hypothetical protein